MEAMHTLEAPYLQSKLYMLPMPLLENAAGSMSGDTHDWRQQSILPSHGKCALRSGFGITQP